MESLLPVTARIARLLTERGETLAVAESSAGGLIAAALLANAGASAWFVAGAVVYTRSARRQLMGITDAEFRGLRSSTEPYAQLLARTSRQRHGADWGLAETGAAGPAGNRYGDASGHSCIAVSGGVGEGVEQVFTLETADDDRIANMRAFARAALDALEGALSSAPASERRLSGR